VTTSEQLSRTPSTRTSTATLTAFDIEEDDNFGWSCVIRDEDFNEIQAHDFESEDELREYLATARVEIA
jgi:hypothetical protein